MARTSLNLPFSGKRTRELRWRAGLSLVDLATRCTELGAPIKYPQLSKIERGVHKPRPALLTALATSLANGNVDALMDLKQVSV